ncbi:MAG: DeoR/GlpR transcriptional regulator [Spirochaetales bacterium]|nr:DeoR/GlpR transcriptional regulator [Spirochaetales bacterium]
MISHLTPREQKIIDLIMEDTLISVAELSGILGVSQVTVRSDFQNLSEKGYLVKTEKGVLPAFHPAVIEREKSHYHEKERIARYAASLVESGDTIMIEAGTTTSLIARFLFSKRDIHIVTNSALVLPYGRVHPSLHIVLLGGEFRPSTESFVGPVTITELANFHVRLAFVGTDGFTVEKGLTTHLLEGAEVVRKMSEQSIETVLLADSSKYGRAGFVKVLPIEKANTIVTDTSLDSDAAGRIQDLGIDLRLV